MSEYAWPRFPWRPEPPGQGARDGGEAADRPAAAARRGEASPALARMDTWCFNIKSRRSLLVSPDGGRPGLPTWYKEPTHSFIQQDAHKCILDLGSAIHRQYMEASSTEWKQSVEDAKSAVLIWALKEKTEAVKNALFVAEQQKNKELEALKNKHIDVLKEEIKKTEIRLRWEYQQEAKKHREAAEQRLAQEIQQTLEKCAAEKENAIYETILEQTNIASENLENVVSVLKVNAVMQQEAVLQHSLKKMEEEYEKKITEEVERVHKEEKMEAEAPIIILQSRHQSEIDHLKHLLCDKEENLKEIYERVETMTILEMELENELRETRSAFQDYINLTYPKLPPEQVQFILPPRRICRSSQNSLCNFKPQKAQKRPQT